MEGRGRPNRSDVHLSKEEEAKIEGETRDHFDDLAPKRHTKPQRSEYSNNYTDALPSDPGADIPEYLEFQNLEHDSQKLTYNGSEAAEEFVETEYYKDLNGVDKQHHTTGTGFIKVEDTNGSFNLESDSATSGHPSSKGNPATNKWIPAAADTKLTYNESEAAEEFVETEYYKDLNGVDKQHHTTGTGFIKLENTNSFNLEPDSETSSYPSSKGNPATNEWIPAAADMGSFVSDKPGRSDN